MAYITIVCLSIGCDEEDEYMNVWHDIEVDPFGRLQTDFDGNTINKETKAIPCAAPFQMDEIQNESEISIYVQIRLKDQSIDRNTEGLIANINSKQFAHTNVIQSRNFNSYSKLQNENEQLKSQVQKMQIDHMEAIKSSNRLKAEITRLKAEITRLKAENGELNEECKETKAIKSSNRLKTEITRLKAEITRLKAENGELNEECKETKAIKSSNRLKAEIIRLKAENGELNEECKETKVELIRVKKELRQAGMNTSNYLEWTDVEVVDWISSIHDGAYAQYEQDLRVFFVKEGVNGAMLSEISKPDLKDWGIQSFSHRSNLYKDIQKLINQPGQAVQDHSANSPVPKQPMQQVKNHENISYNTEGTEGQSTKPGAAYL
eukprot:645205_1